MKEELARVIKRAKTIRAAIHVCFCGLSSPAPPLPLCRGEGLGLPALREVGWVWQRRGLVPTTQRGAEACQGYADLLPGGDDVEFGIEPGSFCGGYVQEV